MGINLEEILAILNGDLIALRLLENELRSEESRDPLMSHYTVSRASSQMIDHKRDISQLLIKNDLKEYADIFLRLPAPSDDFSARRARDIVVSYIAELEYIIKELSASAEDLENKGEKKPRKRRGNKVFIVHGHDKANLYELRDLLKDRYSLECIIMMWKPGKGRTLIEKFEQEAQDAGFAFIIMTPDDLVKIPGKEKEYGQARPNVIFEVGWFYGRLGRNRVCILFKKGTQIHSDLDGISRIEFNESVEEKVLEIENELRAAGLIQ
jgi:predicted nucleotide-binding protein